MISRGYLWIVLAGGLLGGPLAAPAEEVAASPAAVEISPAKIAKIRELLDLTGAKKQADLVLAQSFERLEAKYPSLPPSFWVSLKEKLNVDGMIDLLVPLYAKYYSDEDIDGLIAFHQSALGRKMAAVQGPLLLESREVARKWAAAQLTPLIEAIRQAQAAAPSPAPTPPPPEAPASGS